MTRSRENCSINNHRLTCERQEGDFYQLGMWNEELGIVLQSESFLMSRTAPAIKGVFLLAKSFPLTGRHCSYILLRTQRLPLIWQEIFFTNATSFARQANLSC